MANHNPSQQHQQQHQLQQQQKPLPTLPRHSTTKLQRSNLDKTYALVLRCCLIPVLGADNASSPSSSSSSSSSLYPHSRPHSGGGGGGSSSAYTSHPSTSNSASADREPRSFADDARRAAEKIKQHVKAVGGGDPFFHQHGAANDSLTSFIQADTVLLSTATFKMFKTILTSRVNMFNAAAGGGGGGMQGDPRTGTFARAGSRLLRERMQESANLQLLANLRDLIMVVGAYVQKELPKNLNPPDHDKYLLLTAELFTAILREAVQKAEPRNSAVLHHPLLKDQDTLKVVLHAFLTNNNTSSASSSASPASQAQAQAPLNNATSASSAFSATATSLSEWTRVVFDIKKEDHRRTIAQLKKTAAGNERSVFTELKAQLDEVVRDQCPGATPADFQSAAAYDAWKSRQTQLLQALLQTFLQRFPNTVRDLSTSSTNGAAYPTSPAPSNPRATYRLLLDTCLKHDMQQAQNTGSGGGGGGGGAFTLSKLSVALLSECAIRWKLPKEYKEIVHLDLLVTHYTTGVLIEDDLYPRFRAIAKASRGCDAWTVADRSYYVSVLDTLAAALHHKLRNFAAMLGWKEKTPDGCNSTLQLVALILSDLREDAAWCSHHPEMAAAPGKLDELVREELLEAVNARYRACSDRVAALPREIIRLTTSVKAVNSDMANYRLYFRDPIFGISVSLIAAETCLKYFILEMENMRFSLQGDFDIAEMLELYQAVKLLRDMCDESRLQIVQAFDVESWFAPFISQWLTLTDQKWLEWARSAVSVEKYEPYHSPLAMHSTSVMDLFTCFHAGLDFIENLAWRESAKKERLMTDFVKMMSKSLQEYGALMWEELEHVDTDHTDGEVAFTYQSCIKLNNVLAAHAKLAALLAKIPQASAAATIPHTAPRSEPHQDKSTITLTVLRASGLKVCDWTTGSSDPYVVLSHEGQELHRTRVVYRNLAPAYNQTFQLHVPHTLRDNQSFLDLIVRDRDLVGSDDVCGEAAVFMRDSKLDDFLSHDMTIALRPQGRLSLRVRKEGEIDAIAYWVRRAQQGLEHLIDDMVRVCMEQLARCARASFIKMLPATASARKHPRPISIALGRVGGGSAASGPSADETVSRLMPLLAYLDKTLGTWNEALDRKLLNTHLVMRQPNLAPLTSNSVVATGAASARPHAKPQSGGYAKRAQTRAAKRGAALEDAERTHISDESADEATLLARPSTLALYAFHELALVLSDVLTTHVPISANAASASATATATSTTTTSAAAAAAALSPPPPASTAAETTTVLAGGSGASSSSSSSSTVTAPPPAGVLAAISNSLEIVKTLFACPAEDGTVGGFALEELEACAPYAELRRRLDVFIKAAGV
ncbi:hypothetical protein HDU86_007880 [Geranomyces michiganensis]|nr:hypothetical protein HDU86_007880 [Geranomyces michiganensis]